MKKLILLLLFLLNFSVFSQTTETINKFYDAIFANDIKIVQQLLKKDFPANSEPKNKITPLQASIWQKNLNLVKLLVENGANIDSKKKSAVLEASEKGEIKILKYLIEKGGNIKTSEAFSVAGLNNCYECAKLLLLNGANQTIGDIRGKLWIFEQAVIKSDYQVLDLLKMNNDEINNNNCNGETALIIAIKKNNIDMVKYLLKIGVNKNKPETFNCGDDITYGLKPIQIAKKSKRVEIIKLLI